MKLHLTANISCHHGSAKRLAAETCQITTLSSGASYSNRGLWPSRAGTVWHSNGGKQSTKPGLGCPCNGCSEHRYFPQGDYFASQGGRVADAHLPCTDLHRVDQRELQVTHGLIRLELCQACQPYREPYRL
jgi:hypothetical protein